MTCVKWLMFCKGCVALSLNHFWPMFPFYTPWKHQRFFGVFRGYKMWTLARNRLNNTLIMADMNKVQKPVLIVIIFILLKSFWPRVMNFPKISISAPLKNVTAPLLVQTQHQPPQWSELSEIWNYLKSPFLEFVRKSTTPPPPPPFPPGGSPLSEPSQTSKMDLFVQIVNGFFICIPFRSQVKSQH